MDDAILARITGWWLSLIGRAGIERLDRTRFPRTGAGVADGLTFSVATANVEPMWALGRALLIELRLNRALPLAGRALTRGFAVPAGMDAVLPEDLFEAGCALGSVAPGEGVWPLLFCRRRRGLSGGLGAPSITPLGESTLNIVEKAAYISPPTSGRQGGLNLGTMARQY